MASYYESGSSYLRYYEVTEDCKYFYVSGASRITFFGNVIYDRYLGKVKSMRDVYSMIKADSDCDTVKAF